MARELVGAVREVEAYMFLHGLFIQKMRASIQWGTLRLAPRGEQGLSLPPSPLRHYCPLTGFALSDHLQIRQLPDQLD